MNANTVNAIVGGTGRGQSPVVSLAATTETAFKVTTDTGTTTAFLLAPGAGSQTTIGGAKSPIDPNGNAVHLSYGGRQYGQPYGGGQAAPYFNPLSFDSDRPFRVNVVGYGNAGANAAQSAIVNLYCGTSATLGSDTKIATTGAALAMVAGGAFSYRIIADLQWDSLLQLLTGWFTAEINFTSKAASQFTAPAILSNYAAVTVVTGLSFVPSVVFGNGAASTCQLVEFSVDQT